MKNKRLVFIFVVLLGLSTIIYWGYAKREKEVSPEAAPEVDTSPIIEELEEQKIAFKPFPVYTDARSPDNHFIPSGYMGDYGDINIDEAWMDNPRSGTTSIRVSYSGEISQGARWAGVYWQNPANNWGEKQAGFDLTGATKLTFWARGEKGGERIEEFKMGGIMGEYPDSDAAGIGPVVLAPEWKQYTIDLTGRNLSHIIGGFCWATNVDVNPEGAVFFLDDIKYE